MSARGAPPGESKSSPYLMGTSVHVVTEIHFADEHALNSSCAKIKIYVATSIVVDLVPKQ